MKTPRQEPPGRGGKGKPGPKNQAPGRQKGPSRPGSGGGRPPDQDRPVKAPEAPRPERLRPPGSGESRPGRGRPKSGRQERDAAPEAILARPGRELLYGRNSVGEALRGRRDVGRLYIAEGVREDDRLRALMALAAQRGREIDRVPREMLDDATRGANHQGVALEVEPYRYTALEDIVATPGVVLVLDHLQDPQNFGTLLRAAEAAGVAGVVIPEDRAASVTPAVVNASAGAVEHLRLAATPNLVRALEALKKSGRWVAGLDAGPSATDIFTTDLPTPAVLVVGGESSGLSAQVRKTCDLLVSLPMLGKVESLNAATAGSIALYEMLRRERATTGGQDQVEDRAVGVAGDASVAPT